jgi:hypothetical protein
MSAFMTESAPSQTLPAAPPAARPAAPPPLVIEFPESLPVSGKREEIMAAIAARGRMAVPPAIRRCALSSATPAGSALR